LDKPPYWIGQPHPESIILLIAALVLSWISLSGVGITGREVRWRRTRLKTSPVAIHIRIRGVIPGSASIGRNVVISTTRGWVIIHGRSAARRRPIGSCPVVIVVATRGGRTLAIAITIPAIATGAVSTGRSSAIILINATGRVTHGRTRTGTISSGIIRLGLFENVSTSVGKWWSSAYVGRASDPMSFELAAVQLLNSCSKVIGSLKLDEARI
jgi:hypothetical protein